MRKYKPVPPEERVVKRRKSTSRRLRPPARGTRNVNNSWTSPKRILARERQAEALQMRKEGQTFAEISKHFSVTAKTAMGR
jgi:hypothetical protein